MISNKKRVTMNIWKDDYKFIDAYLKKRKDLSQTELYRMIINDWATYMRSKKELNQ
jgi:hypothetical protein